MNNTNTKSFNHDNAFIYVCVLIAILTIGTIVFYCYCDTNIGADEVFSYGFANNKDCLFMTKEAMEECNGNNWIPGSFINHYYSINSGEYFNFMISHRQAREDVHPPLYFMLLNFACSFFPDQATTVPGHIINAFCAIAICIIIYLISLRLFNNKWFAFVPVVSFVGSVGFEDLTEYIRMYLPLCVLTLTFMLLCMLLTDMPDNKQWIYPALGTITVLGTLMHYYFYIMCILTCFVTYLILIKEHNRKTRVKFIISESLGAVISFCAYPYVFDHILHSDRGEQVANNLRKFDLTYYKNHLIGFLKTYNTELFNGSGIIILLLILMLICFTVLLSAKPKSNQSKTNQQPKAIKLFSGKQFHSMIILAIPSFLYWCILFKISYSYRWSYISPTYAPITILCCFLLITLLCKINPKIAFPVSITIAFLFWGSHLYNVIPDLNNYRNMHKSCISLAKSYSQKRDCIFIYDEWSTPHYGKDLELMNYPYTFFVSANDIMNEDFVEILANKPGNDNDLILYIHATIPETDKIAAYIGKIAKRDNVRLIASNDFMIYIVD